MNRSMLKLSLTVLPILTLAVAASATLPTRVTPPPVEDEADLQARYEQLAAAKDRAGMVALWTAHPDQALVTFDADLERSLALWEASPEEPLVAEIEELHERALFAARAASEALGTPIFADYAACFISWSDQSKRDFRDGQKLVSDARAALDADDAVRASELGMNAYLRTVYLGDWWGQAMALSVRGRALQASSSFEHALAAYAQARQLYHDLHLTRSELDNLRRMVNMCVLLENWTRADVACDAALKLSAEVGAKEELVAELQRARKRIDQVREGQ